VRVNSENALGIHAHNIGRAASHKTPASGLEGQKGVVRVNRARPRNGSHAQKAAGRKRHAHGNGVSGVRTIKPRASPHADSCFARRFTMDPALRNARHSPLEAVSLTASRKTPPRVAHHLRHARALVSSAGAGRLRAPSIQLNACQPSARQPSRCQKRFTSTGLHRIPTPLAGVLQAAQHRFCTCELTARFPSSQVQKWHPARWKTPARRPGDESGLVLVNGCPDHYPFTSTKPARLVPQVIRETTQMNR
jgi:hypothetical protein